MRDAVRPLAERLPARAPVAPQPGAVVAGCLHGPAEGEGVRRHGPDPAVDGEVATVLEVLHGPLRAAAEDAVEGAGVVAVHAEHALEDGYVPTIVAFAECPPAEDGRTR